MAAARKKAKVKGKGKAKAKRAASRRRRYLSDRMEAVGAVEGDSFHDAWIGLEPTFQTKECVELYAQLEDDEQAYFEHPHMIGTVKQVGDDMVERYRRALQQQEPWALFSKVDVEEGKDDWDLFTKKLTFTMPGAAEPFQLQLGMDPATFELSMRPLPLAWLYDERFVRFLDAIVYEVPQQRGCSTSLLNGGGQFHISAKTMLTGSLLCDDLATRLSHPELSTWIMDWPNCDGRSFRATPLRFRAFCDVVERYRRGAFHPEATGVPTVETAYFDHWPDLPDAPPRGLVNRVGGPRGDKIAVFQTNFAFGRAVKQNAQRVQPGYWQLQHPHDDGYRPDQIMRYSETNLARLQIIGELHVKKDVPLLPDEAFELDAPLEPRMLHQGASYEIRAQASKRSAKDYVDAVLLDVHAWRWLRAHPGVDVAPSLLQDQLLIDAERTVAKHAGQPVLDQLRKESRAKNEADSFGRVRSDFVEPETLFWAAWRALPARAQAAIAREAITGFVERVENAASMDPRGAPSDPMDVHRHRVHPLLWEALAADARAKRPGDVVGRELRAYRAKQDLYAARRPPWSQVESEQPPWVLP
jgi:hypothetical protein